VRAIEAEKTVSFLNVSFEPRESQLLLVIISLAVGALFLGMGLLEFAFFRKLVRLSRTFEEFNLTRLYKKVVQAGPVLTDEEHQVLEPYNIRKSLLKDVKFYGRALFTIVKAAIPLSKLVFSLGFMFYLSFTFTLLIVLIMGLGAFFFIKVSRSVVQDTFNKEKYIRTYLMDLSEALKNPIRPEQLIGLKSTKGYFSAFYNRLINAEKNRLVIQTQIAVIVVVILLIAGHLTLFGNVSWSLLIGYMIGLRFFLNSLQGINSFLKQAGKYYDYIRNYRNILLALDDLIDRHELPSVIRYDTPLDYFIYQPDDDDDDDFVDDF
jgi:hypothetical protein